MVRFGLYPAWQHRVLWAFGNLTGFPTLTDSFPLSPPRCGAHFKLLMHKLWCCGAHSEVIESPSSQWCDGLVQQRWYMLTIALVAEWEIESCHRSIDQSRSRSKNPLFEDGNWKTEKSEEILTSHSTGEIYDGHYRCESVERKSMCKWIPIKLPQPQLSWSSFVSLWISESRTSWWTHRTRIVQSTKEQSAAENGRARVRAAHSLTPNVTY